MVRKKLTAFNSKSTPKDEAELLFLLSSHKHDNIVELLTSYSQDGVPNLIFERADMDLHDFLLQERRIYWFEEDTAVFRALHGLSSGLKYIHGFKPTESHRNEVSDIQMFGCHQDIKPRNILVRGTNFILADFGLMRLKTSNEDSKTLWKDGTYEYGAPECRHPVTFQQGRIGRASDIWSLGCIASELMVYIQKGHAGISVFRDLRVTDNTYGKTRCFHDNVGLNQDVMEYLSRIGAETGGDADLKPISELFLLTQDMFATIPANRPDANLIESRLSCITTKALLKDLLEALEAYLIISSGDLITNVFRVRLRLEEKRLCAWAVLLGLHPLHGHKTILGSQSFNSFPQIWKDLEAAIRDLKINRPFEATHFNEDFVVLKMQQTNDSIYSKLSDIERASADGIFAALSTADTETRALLSISQLSQGKDFQYQDIGAIAAMKYMSILLSRQPESLQQGSRIDQSLIEKDSKYVNIEVQPETFWYNFGYQENERDKVLIEWKDYGAKWKQDPKSREFQERGEAMFGRIQGLVAMLRQSKPAGFKVLDCLGCFHDAQQQKFGIVYKFPSNQSIPIRLHHLLRKRDHSAKICPHIGEKVALAKALAVSLHTFHMSGWIHKDFNSHNVIFFAPSTEYTDVQLAQPYIVGFQHSREDQEGAYTEGPGVSSEWRKYQHPKYQTGSKSFKREYDYYSFGIVLLEIGGWERLSNIYSRWETENPSQLRDRYIRICNERILERMGPIYHAVTKACLLADSQFSGKELDSAIDFQRDVVDKLSSCCL